MEKPNIKLDFKFKDLLFFDRLIMPSVITLLYWAVLVFVVLSGLLTMFFVGFFSGFFGILIGAIVTRISFELTCVSFSINRNLEKLVQLQSQNSNAPSTPNQVGKEADDFAKDELDNL
ncbi:hypothetical protein RCS94_08870 [Orbaceae bacterium ac157xtp]